NCSWPARSCSRSARTWVRPPGERRGRRRRGCDKKRAVPSILSGTTILQGLRGTVPFLSQPRNLREDRGANPQFRASSGIGLQLLFNVGLAFLVALGSSGQLNSLFPGGGRFR